MRIRSQRSLCRAAMICAIVLSTSALAYAWPQAADDTPVSGRVLLPADAINRLKPDADGLVFFGDMAYKLDDIKRLGFGGAKWPSGIVPIAFHANVSSDNQARFFEACAEWTRVARVRCIKRTNEADYVAVESGPGNWSQVGRRGGMQRLQMFNWNWKFIIAHEIAHAVGAGHEQTRLDRNQYVQIHWENMERLDEVGHNFTILPLSTYNQPYDFGSVMHYSPFAFSKNGLPTISPRPGYEQQGALMGNRAALSRGDIDNMRRHYGAPQASSDLVASSERGPGSSALWRSASTSRAAAGPKSIWEDGRTIESIEKMGAEDKVFGGTPVVAGALRDVVGITEPNSNAASCTGTLISPTVVLTAKHCVCGGVNGQVLVGEKEATAQRYPVKRFVPQLAQCSQPVTKADLDLGLLILASPIPGVTPRQFAAEDLIDKAFSYRVAGFGYRDLPDGGLAAGEKYQTVVPSASNDCKGRPGGWTAQDSEAYGCKRGVEIVAGAPGLGRDTCNGDSGGGLFIGPEFHGSLKLADTELRLAGVTSRAISIQTGEIPCGDAGIYVRITKEVSEWITQAGQ